MVAPVVISTSVVVHLAADAVWVGSATGVVASPDEALRGCLDGIDDEFVDSAQHAQPAVEMLAAAIGRAVGTGSGRDGFVGVMTVLHPSHWGRARRAVLGAAARRAANEVETVPIALAVPAPTGSGGWIVVECAETSTTVVAVRPGSQGPPTIVACALAPRTGTLDLEADSARISVVDGLLGEVAAGGSFATVCVVGPSADMVARLLSAGLARDVRVVPEAALVAGRTAFSESGSGAATSEPVRGSWVDRVPEPGPTRTTGRSRRSVLTAVAIVAAVLLTAVGSVIAVRYMRGTDRPHAGAPLQRVEIGRVSTELPDAWQVRGDRSARLDLAPGDGRGGRILLLPTELAAGSGREAVVRGLERKIGERGSAGPFSDFTSDIEFGGRQAVGYVESPADGSRVRWFVLVEDDVQVSVGCQYRDVGWEAIAADCEQAVRAVTVGPAG